MRLPLAFPKKKKPEDELEPMVEFQEFDEPIEDIQARIAKTNPELIPEMDFLPDENDPSLEDLPELENSALAGLKEHLTRRPRREEHRPSGGRKILSGLAAGLAAASGVDPTKAAEFGRNRNNRKFNDATEDWMMEGGKLKDLASIEERSNVAREGISARREASKEAARQRDVAEKRHRESLDETKRYHDVLDKNADATRESTEQSRREARQNSQNNRDISRVDKGEKDLRTEYQRRTKAHDEARLQFKQIENLGKQAGSVAELSELMKMISSIDDTAAREGEVNTQREARSFKERVNLWFTRLDKSAAVTPQMRSEIQAASAAMHKAVQEDRKLLQRQYSDLSRREGLNIRNIVLDFEEDNPDDDAVVDSFVERINGGK